MPITSHIIIKARRNYLENYASNEEISEWSKTKLVESDMVKDATKDFSEVILKVV
jgi:hypothetical protein